MWKRESTPQEKKPAPAATETASPALPSTERAVEKMSTGTANIGKSVVIKGELNGSEDLVIEGQVEGKIELRDHLLTVGKNGRIRAEIFAKNIVVHGQVIGNIVATERVSIRENGSVDGDVVAPRVSIAEGASFRGKIDMQGGAAGMGKIFAEPHYPKAAHDVAAKRDNKAAEKSTEA